MYIYSVHVYMYSYLTAGVDTEAATPICWSVFSVEVVVLGLGPCWLGGVVLLFRECGAMGSEEGGGWAWNTFFTGFFTLQIRKATSATCHIVGRLSMSGSSM